MRRSIRFEDDSNRNYTLYLQMSSEERRREIKRLEEEALEEKEHILRMK